MPGKWGRPRRYRRPRRKLWVPVQVEPHGNVEELPTDSGMGVQVQLLDAATKQKLDVGATRNRWCLWQEVPELIVAVRKSLNLEPWEDIELCQHDTVIPDSVPLSCLVDIYGIVCLTGQRFNVYDTPQASMAVSRAKAWLVEEVLQLKDAKL